MVFLASLFPFLHLGVSENSVPLNPMVLLIIIPIKWLFHWEYTLFSDKPIDCFHFFPSVPRCSVSASHPLRQLFIGALPRMPSLDTLTDSTRADSVEHPAIYQRLYSILQPDPEYV